MINELVHFLDRFSLVFPSLSLAFSYGFTVIIFHLFAPFTFFQVSWASVCPLSSDKVSLQTLAVPSLWMLFSPFENRN